MLYRWIGSGEKRKLLDLIPPPSEASTIENSRGEHSIFVMPGEFSRKSESGLSSTEISFLKCFIASRAKKNVQLFFPGKYDTHVHSSFTSIILFSILKLRRKRKRPPKFFQLLFILLLFVIVKMWPVRVHETGKKYYLLSPNKNDRWCILYSDQFIYAVHTVW